MTNISDILNDTNWHHQDYKGHKSLRFGELKYM